MGIVSDIITQAKARMASLLGATYSELSYVYELTKNNQRQLKLGYGMRPLSATAAEGVTNFYTMSHSFEVILTDVFAKDTDDSEKITKFDTMYENADMIFKDLLGAKINLPLVVLTVNGQELLEPEVFRDDNFLALRMQINVIYRSAHTT